MELTDHLTFSIYFLLLDNPQPVELIPVESGVVDRGALSESFRVEQVDLRQDTSFERLYRVVGSEDIFVRKSGGLTAVFRNAEYRQLPSGEVPIVPAGTTYYIGELPSRLVQQLNTLQNTPEPHPSILQVKPLSHTKKPHQKPQQQAIESILFLENETYRRQRLALFVLEVVLRD